MFFQILSYLKFLKQSTSKHGVHSPFVFDLVTKCFDDRKQYPEYMILDNHRKSLLRNDNVIDVTDFGAGSKVFKSNHRRVSDIAKNAGISRRRAKLLFRLTHYFRSEDILEIGTSVGLATIALSLANKNGHINTLEGCPETAKIAKSTLDNFVSNVDITIGEFSSALSSQKIAGQKFDLIYFDGNHSRKATLQYFNLLLPTAHNNTVWIFDDIHWSDDMELAWNEIKLRPEVTVTIDTYQWGLVFFRSEQQKENFIVRV